MTIRQVPESTTRPTDEEEDGRVVEAAHPAPPVRRPGDAVVERADAEHDGDGRSEDRSRDALARWVVDSDERCGDAERDEERVLVQDAAKPRPAESGRNKR
jgi:hypothetical protein